MPVDNVTLNPPVQYWWLWLVIGILLLVAIGAWYGLMFWFTRRKPVNTLENLKPASSSLDLDALKAKYLKLIDECYENYQQEHTTKRGLHRALSMAVRYFVYEVKHFPAPRLTLADLKRAPYPKLTALVKEYYEKEFAVIEHGDPLASVEAAKELIRQWV